jgi:hypothetical protein
MSYPVVYVRGYAMTDKAVEDTFNLPYYGFNLGAARYRQGSGSVGWRGRCRSSARDRSCGTARARWR